MAKCEISAAELSSGLQVLYADVHNDLQEMWSGWMEDIEEGFTFLAEIVAEASRELQRSSPQIKTLPKTPGAKKKKGRQKKTVLQSDSENDDPQVSLSLKPTQLKFNLNREPKDIIQEPEPEEPAKKGRATRQRVASTANQGTPKTRATRASRRAVNKNNTSASSSNLSLAENSILKDSTSAKVNASSSVDKLPLGVAGDHDEGSPTVRVRAQAYEEMLRHRNSQSPVKSHSPVKSSSAKEKCEPTKPNRTRLRLKKKVVEDEANTKDDVADSPQNVASELDTSKEHAVNVMNETEVFVNEVFEIDEKSSKAKLTEYEKVKTKTNENVNVLDETQVVVTEVFEVGPKGTPAKLKEYEKVKTKTTPTAIKKDSVSKLVSQPLSRLSSDQGFNDGDDEDDDKESDDEIYSKDCFGNKELAVKKSTRTYTRKRTSKTPILESYDSDDDDNSVQTKEVVPAKSSNNPVFISTSEESLDNKVVNKSTRTYTHKKTKTHDKHDSDGEDNSEQNFETASVKSTRTFTRASKTTSVSALEDTMVNEPIKSARTRTRCVGKADEVAEATEVQRSTRTRARKQKESESNTPEMASTRTRTRASKQKSIDASNQTAVSKAKQNVLLSDDEIVASSPVDVSNLRVGQNKKRLLEERGNSPKPKRSRSIIGDPDVNNMITSSPIKNRGEECDRVLHLSPPRTAKSFNFSSCQMKKSSSFLNRTPGFGNISKVQHSFLKTTPTSQRSSSVLTSFIKRNTPTQKVNQKDIQEQKKQKLLEKEQKNKERLQRAAELRKRRIEEAKRQREEKERRVAEVREKQQRSEMAQQDRINKKLEEKAALKAKLAEERQKEERDKQKIRMKKQLEADNRRKQEEEERLKKIIQAEEEAKEQEEFMRRKKEHEEAERRRRIEEEKRREEERRAEMERARKEEIARKNKQEEEREREWERARVEKQRQEAYEKAERDRIEREKRDERERKLKEELAKLKAMEKERLEKEAQRHQQTLKEKAEMERLINLHNQGVKNNMNTTQTLASNTSIDNKNSQTYDMTPVKKKVITASKNPDNYDIEDKGSDESTDEDDAPKKKVPEWASGTQLRTALIRQFSNPPDLDALFLTKYIEQPDLMKIFPNVKRKDRFKKRTSSAIWTSPVLKRF